jgi:hypothetical protein
MAICRAPTACVSDEGPPVFSAVLDELLYPPASTISDWRVSPDMPAWLSMVNCAYIALPGAAVGERARSDSTGVDEEGVLEQAATRQSSIRRYMGRS